MPRERPRILVVDDDPVTCELLCEVFEREGFAARSEQSGEAALASLNGESPDVILSDIRMKTRVDGLALLDRVRRELPSTPVVLMTAFGSIDTAIRAVKEGAFDYVSKPFDLDTMVATGGRALSSRPPGRANRGGEEGEGRDLPPRLVGRPPAMLEIY